VEWSASTALTMVSLSGVVQRGLDDGRGALSVNMVASMIVAMRFSALKMDQRLMAAMNSLAWAWGARYESARQDGHSCFA
jgi:hypothetical protein